MSTGSSNNILNFTEDLLIRVYKKLSRGSDRKSWRLVCRGFLRVDSVTRNHLRVLRVEFLPSLLRKSPGIQSLDLSVCSRIDDGTISLLMASGSGLGSDSLIWANCARGLKSLVLSRATGLSFSGLEALVNACPLLEKVDVSYCCGFGDQEAAALSFAAELRVLKMDKCLNVSDMGLAKIAVRCGKLEQLSLKWCLEITDLGIGLLCKKCIGLKSLDISYLKVTNESLRSIASLQKLEVLTMIKCSLVDNAGLKFLENGCPSLQVIDVSRCEYINSFGLILVLKGHNGLRELNASYSFSELCTTFLQYLKGLKHLEALRIDGSRIAESSFSVISSHCKSLVEIGLSKCVGVNNTGIMKLVTGCVNLRILNLTCCHSITDAAISSIANSCKNLVCLKLESCNMITEKSLYQLGSFCLQLQEVDLTDCCGVNDKGLEYLSSCTRILCLKLGLCANISDRGLYYIGSNCPNIRDLDLYRCTGIGDEGIAALTKGCKKMMKLNLSYCSGITDRGMEYICCLEELSDLEMRGLEKVTGVGLTAIAAGCKRLADLDLKHCEQIEDSGFWSLAYYSKNLRQINLSQCAISDMALCIVMGSLTRLQDAKLVSLPNVSVEGFEVAIRACCIRLKKVKLCAPLRLLLSSEILENLHARGCKIRWD